MLVRYVLRHINSCRLYNAYFCSCVYIDIGSVNIHKGYVTANNSTNNNIVFFLVSDLKTVYYNNN